MPVFQVASSIFAGRGWPGSPLVYAYDDGSSSGTFLMPPAQIGPYRIVRPLGEGGMGAVYEAIQEPIERRVALKVLLPQHAQNPDALSRFFNEARAVNRIEHPSIVQVSDYGQALDGTAYLVMECLRGETLSSRLTNLHARGARLPMYEATQIAAQIADALTAAHDKSIVHRDLKPGNVMLVRDPAVPGGERAKILDFGIAKLTQGQDKGTATNALIGTPQYMSPEQCRGAGGVDDKTDVYALGVMLYQMLADRPPFLGENAIEYMAQHAFQEPVPLRNFAPQAHPDLAALVHRLLIKDKAIRPSMREVGAELSNFLARLPGANPEITRPPAIDGDKAQWSVGPVSQAWTLGGALGQTLQPRRIPLLRLVGASVGLALVLIMTLGSLLLSRPSRQQLAIGVVPSQPADPAVALLHPVPLPAVPNHAGASTVPPSQYLIQEHITPLPTRPPIVNSDTPKSRKLAVIRPLTVHSLASGLNKASKEPTRANQLVAPARKFKPIVESGQSSKPPTASPPPITNDIYIAD